MPESRNWPPPGSVAETWLEPKYRVKTAAPTKPPPAPKNPKAVAKAKAAYRVLQQVAEQMKGTASQKSRAEVENLTRQVD